MNEEWTYIVCRRGGSALPRKVPHEVHDVHGRLVLGVAARCDLAQAGEEGFCGGVERTEAGMCSRDVVVKTDGRVAGEVRGQGFGGGVM